MDKFIVKRIIKRVDIHIASVQCKKWSNLDYYASKNPFSIKKIIPNTEDVIETKNEFLQDMHRIWVGGMNLWKYVFVFSVWVCIVLAIG